ncbi:MAG: hypothetical protein [Chaetfec virus UA24_244]|nr:MAG: hypothetical protein [Chaetfec virus UA24_244]
MSSAGGWRIKTLTASLICSAGRLERREKNDKKV